MLVAGALFTSIFGTLALSATAFGQRTSPALSQTVRIEASQLRSTRAIDSAVDRAARLRVQRVAALTAPQRAKTWRGEAPFTMPVRVELWANGQPLPGGVGKRAGDITLEFATSGEDAFPTDVRTELQAIFNAVRPTLNALFGPPRQAGTVRVVNADLSLPDRQVVVGGIYVPNSAGQRQIRFPIYSNREAAAINFVHCLLLAYQGQSPYGSDAFQEGLVRAIVARAARTSGTLPGYLPESIEQVLFNTYEVGPFYDWYNQPALSARTFIAENLLKDPLPSGGSVGGLYLLRYRMSGSAWQKVLEEFPSFARELNARVEADPSLATDLARLITVGQEIISALQPTRPTVEGRSFADWLRRQWILQPVTTPGPKLLLQATPIFDGLSGPDFGVFNLEAHYFQTAVNGDEILLSGVAWPVFWDHTFTNRLSPSAQDERMDFAGAYASVGPNFTNDLGGQNYRVAADVGIGGMVARALLPVGAIARAGESKVNTLYGTVSGERLALGETLAVRVTIPSGAQTVPVQNNAFGARVTLDGWTRSQRVVVDVLSVSGATVTGTLLTRVVNKGPGDLALDLRINEEVSLNYQIAQGLNHLGTPFQPFRPDLITELGITPANYLLARYNPSRARYELYPDTQPLGTGLGFFLQSPVERLIRVDGLGVLIPTSVHLRPGWNQVTTPTNLVTGTNRIRVVKAADLPRTIEEAAGVDIGADIFEFVPSPGNPNAGSYQTVTSLRPGVAYWSRSLAPEGLTLLFAPSSTGPGKGFAAAPASKARDAAPAFRTRFDLTVGARTVTAFAELRDGSTVGFDRRWDSDFPPSGGGLQVFVGDRRYRDVRPVTNFTEFPVFLEGLTPGQPVSLRITQTDGRRRNVMMIDPVQHLWAPVNGTYVWRFTPRATTARLVLRVGAPR